MLPIPNQQAHPPHGQTQPITGVRLSAADAGTLALAHAHYRTGLATRSGDSPYAIWGYMVTEHELQCFLYNQGTIVPYHLLATIAAAQDPSAFVARNYLHQSYQHPAAYGTHANPIQGPYPFNMSASAQSRPSMGNFGQAQFNQTPASPSSEFGRLPPATTLQSPVFPNMQSQAYGTYGPGTPQPAPYGSLGSPPAVSGDYQGWPSSINALQYSSTHQIGRQRLPPQTVRPGSAQPQSPLEPAGRKRRAAETTTAPAKGVQASASSAHQHSVIDLTGGTPNQSSHQSTNHEHRDDDLIEVDPFLETEKTKKASLSRHFQLASIDDPLKRHYILCPGECGMIRYIKTCISIHQVEFRGRNHANCRVTSFKDLVATKVLVTRGELRALGRQEDASKNAAYRWHEGLGRGEPVKATDMTKV